MSDLPGASRPCCSRSPLPRWRFSAAIVWRLPSLVAGALTVVATGHAAADRLAEFVPPVADDGLCWERVYPDAHLTRHPRQKVAAMRLLLAYAPGRRHHVFDIDVATRSRAGSVHGTCAADEDGVALCSVACDGGRLRLRRADDAGAILVDIGETGRLQVNARCGDNEGAEPFAIEAQPDDRIFRLQPVTVRTCTVKPFAPYRDGQGE